MQAWIDTKATSSSMLELPRVPRRRYTLARKLWRHLQQHRWDLAYLPVPAIPVLTLFVLLYARYVVLEHPRQFLGTRLDFFYGILVANVLLGFGLSIWAYFLFSERRGLFAEMRAFQKREGQRSNALLRLEKEMELLTAMRDLSRIINDDVEFVAVWNRVLDVLGSLVPCRRITIFTLDEAGQPVPRILHFRGRTCFGEDIDEADLDSTNVAETLAHRSILRLSEGANLFWTYPLVADGEVLGVMQIVVGLEDGDGDLEDKADRIERHEETIRTLLKHISLALKTPELYDRAVLDGLTGLANKRHFQAHIQQAFGLASRNGTPFSLVMSDIDFFKHVNDTYGHVAGDQCLKVIAKVVQREARTCDLVFRYGGEEVCILLPETDVNEAAIVAERIHKAISEAEIPVDHEDSPLRVTASMGVCQFHKSMEAPDDMVAKADAALYQAKRRGRNQSWTYSKDGELVRTPNSPKARMKKPKNAR